MAFIGLSKISIHLMYAIAVTVDTAIEKLQKEQKNDTNFSKLNKWSILFEIPLFHCFKKKSTFFLLRSESALRIFHLN